MVSALLDVKHCPNLQSCAIPRKNNYATLRKWRKPLLQTQFGSPKTNDFGIFCTKFDTQIFFRRIYLYEMLYIVASYHCMKF